MKKNNNLSTSRHLGTFQILDNDVVGELTINGKNTNLRIYSDSPTNYQSVTTAKGISYSGEQLTLIDCIGQSPSFSLGKNGKPGYHSDIFPHYVAVGSHHFDPTAECIKEISYRPKDICILFRDFDAFGQNIVNREDIERLTDNHARSVSIGDHPHIVYFTGNFCVIEVDTAIGKFSVQHSPSISASTSGAHIDNRMRVYLEFPTPVTFNKALDNLHILNCFLSLNAGRVQGIKNIKIDASFQTNKIPQKLSITASYPTKTSGKSRFYEPHAGDIPIDPINSPDEFKTTLNNWIDRHQSWADSRWRYIGCLRKSNSYDIDRLVAAANMFDILPSDAVPAPEPVQTELLKARDESRAMFRKLPPTPDRNGILNALGRIGKLSLPKKVDFRIKIVSKHLDKEFPDLSLAGAVGVKLRNYYVHGSLDDLEYDKIKHLMPFLTDALEFIFAASDLIESGWNPQQWRTNHHGFGHSFSRFMIDYKQHISDLQQAVKKEC